MLSACSHTLMLVDLPVGRFPSAWEPETRRSLKPDRPKRGKKYPTIVTQTTHRHNARTVKNLSVAIVLTAIDKLFFLGSIKMSAGLPPDKHGRSLVGGTLQGNIYPLVHLDPMALTLDSFPWRTPFTVNSFNLTVCDTGWMRCRG